MNKFSSEQERVVAAIDLGSNSFHLVIARIGKGGIRTLVRDKERVRLADGLSRNGILEKTAMDRGISCLRRFSSRISSVSQDNVRVVATHSLRKAKNAVDFLDRAENLLDVKVEIIPGSEEARLIFLSVAHTENLNGPFLVFDIGGGSTEFAYGSGYQPTLLSSRSLGSLTFTRHFFKTIDKQSFDRAFFTTLQTLKPIASSFNSLNVRKIFATSGTARAISLLGNHLGYGYKINALVIEEGITHVLKSTRQNSQSIPGVADDRMSTISAGLAIFKGIFYSLGFDSVIVAESALREGVLYTMDEKFKHNDIRERTALDLANRYEIDLIQAKRVRHLALLFFDQVSIVWKFSEEEKQILSWASMLHEIGLQIAYSGFHRHGAYILNHTPLPGFNREQQTALSVLVGQHRKRIDLNNVPDLRQFSFVKLVRLVRLIRLATLFHIGRTELDLGQVSLKVIGDSLILCFAKEKNKLDPALSLDLEQEYRYNESAGLCLRIS